MIAQYSLTGTLLSKFSTGINSTGHFALAFDPADGTLWFNNCCNLFYQYSISGVLLQSGEISNGLPDGGLLAGEFAEPVPSAVPAPASLPLLATGLGLLAWLRRRGDSMKRIAIALAALLTAAGPAGAAPVTYALNPLTLWYQFDPSQTATLTGTITTDGTFGPALGPSIITGWDFLLNDGTHTAEVNTSNSAISLLGCCFSDRWAATPTDLSFNFAATEQGSYFTFGADANPKVGIFAAYNPSNPGQAGFLINLGIHATEHLYANYRSPQLDIIATAVPAPAPVPAPATLPLFATGLGMFGWFGWRRRRRHTTQQPGAGSTADRMSKPPIGPAAVGPSVANTGVDAAHMKAAVRSGRAPCMPVSPPRTGRA